MRIYFDLKCRANAENPRKTFVTISLPVVTTMTKIRRICSYNEVE